MWALKLRRYALLLVTNEQEGRSARGISKAPLCKALPCARMDDQPLAPLCLTVDGESPEEQTTHAPVHSLCSLHDAIKRPIHTALQCPLPRSLPHPRSLLTPPLPRPHLLAWRIPSVPRACAMAWLSSTSWDCRPASWLADRNEAQHRWEWRGRERRRTKGEELSYTNAQTNDPMDFDSEMSKVTVQQSGV